MDKELKRTQKIQQPLKVRFL